MTKLLAVPLLALILVGTGCTQRTDYKDGDWYCVIERNATPTIRRCENHKTKETCIMMSMRGGYGGVSCSFPPQSQTSL